MQAIKAVYKDNVFKPLEPVPVSGDYEVVITFIEPVADVKPKLPMSELIGILKGKGWVADDFDAPLDEMKEYM
jgi:predicted DNA-binding antitoxin AbrB/MazE fold protein